MRVMAQMAMVMNLDKCIRCHTCSVTCKRAWTNHKGTEYVWFNNVETRPGRVTPWLSRSRKWQGGTGLCHGAASWAQSRRNMAKLASIFSTPTARD